MLKRVNSEKKTEREENRKPVDKPSVNQMRFIRDREETG